MNAIVQLIVGLFLIVFCGIFLYLAYILIFDGYPRPLWLGNSAPLEEYMAKTFLPDLVKYSKQTNVSGAYFDLLRSLNDKEYPITKYPELYFPIIFWEALDNIENNLKELALVKQFLKGVDTQKYFKKGSAADIDPSAFKRFKELKDSLKAQMPAIASTAKSYRSGTSYDQTGMSWMVSDLMMNNYLPQIIPMYDMRKSGGVANFMIFKLYFSDYTKYVFSETLPDVWEDFVEVMDKIYETIVGTIKSKKVSSFFSALPMTLAGVSTFEDKKEDLVEGWKYADDDDQTETFIDALINIAKTFIKMFKLISVLVTFVLNPLKFIQVLIGFVVGLFIFLIYTVLVILSPIFYIPAFFYTLVFKLGITIVWLAIYVVNFLIYLILWIVDFATAGAVLQMLRCENLPTAWHAFAGFAKGNIYKRQVFCSYRCGDNYTPKGLVCRRNPKYEPPFCPQQVIYSAFTGNTDDLDNKNLIHKYKPTIKFYKQNEDWRMNDIEKAYNNRVDFIDQCKTTYKDYDHLSKSACRFFINESGPRALKTTDPDKYNNLLDLCYQAYCDFDNEPSFSTFCASHALGNQKRVVKQNKDDQDIITSVVFACVILVVMCLIFTALFKTVTYKQT